MDNRKIIDVQKFVEALEYYLKNASVDQSITLKLTQDTAKSLIDFYRNVKQIHVESTEISRN